MFEIFRFLQKLLILSFNKKGAKPSQEVKDILVLVQLLLGELGARLRNPRVFDSDQQVSQLGREFYLTVVQVKSI